MTSKPVTGIRIKDGKVIPKKSYLEGNRRRKAGRLVKAWKEKSTK